MTILPPGTTKQQFEGWINGLTNRDLRDSNGMGPVSKYGTPIGATAVADDGVFVQVTPNHYIVRMGSDNGVLMTKTGTPFIIEVTPQMVRGR